jgi:hypothetical protein
VAPETLIFAPVMVISSLMDLPCEPINEPVKEFDSKNLIATFFAVSGFSMVNLSEIKKFGVKRSIEK